jgi:creatinine amidohydrolase
MSEARAAHLDWFSFRRRAAAEPIVLGVGSFEQHGPHLPMATDAIIAEALAEAVAERIGGMFLPVVPYGAPSRPLSGGGDVFPAPDLPLPTLFEALESICRGAIAAGARRLVVFTWHYENAEVLWDAVRNAITPESGARAVLFGSPWDLLDAGALSTLFADGEEVDWAADHAGLLETAIMRAIAPQLTGEPPAPVEFRHRKVYDVIPTPTDAVPETGVVNDARSVTAEAGRRCLDTIADALAEAARAELLDG